MSYAIIRNAKYKRENLKGIYRHNERKNNNYSNTNIYKEKSYLNYSLKSPQYSYEKEIDNMQKKYNLKGQIKKVSNIACEYIITSDKDFFEEIGEDETKRYFETAYRFVADYKNLGEQYIISAKVHMDEETPHMHLIFLPVVHTKDKKGNNIDKIACSEFWKEKDSYRQLQNEFYKYVTDRGFNLERGIQSDRKGLTVEQIKKITNFEEIRKSVSNDEQKQEDYDIKVESLENISKFSINRDKDIRDKIINPLKCEMNRLTKENKELKENILSISKGFDSLQNIEEENKILNAKIKTLKKKNLQLNEDNDFLYKVIDTLQNTMEKFIKWICNKFSLSEEDTIHNFEEQTNTYMKASKQIENEEKQKIENMDLEYEE